MRRQDGTFPPGLPHVAYVLLWYPLFTQPFIFREVESLRRRLPMRIYSLYGRNLRHCSEAMRAVADDTVTMGVRALPAVLWEIVRHMCAHPRRLWGMFRQCLCRSWPSWEILGENLWAFCAGLRLARLLRDDGIDFIYAPWPRGTATAAWVAASLLDLPFATSARGDNLEPADPDLAFKLRAATFIRANNAADAERIAVMLGEESRERIFLVRNGMTLPDPGPEGRAPIPMRPPLRLCAIGRFDVTKGFDVLLEACRILVDRGVDFRLTLAGGGGVALGLGGMGEKILRMRSDLGLEDRVDLPGIISHDSLPDLLRAQDVFLAPCVVDPATGKRDGIPNVVIEAMAHGLPVVATNVNALPEVVRDGETGLSVPPHDAAALADAVERLARRPEEARRLGAAGAGLVLGMFSTEDNADRLAALFVTADAARRKACAG